MSYIHPDQVSGKRTFTEAEVAEILELARICQEHDGIESKMSADWFKRRPEGEVNDFFYYVDGRLAGFLMVFSMEKTTAEISGIVHPEFRRQGIFRALVAAATDELKRRGTGRMLFTVDSRSVAGKAFIATMGAQYRFSEYSMKLEVVNEHVVQHEDLKMRLATEADFEFMVECGSKAFGDSADMTRELLQRTNEPNRRSYIAEFRNEPVGVMRVLTYGDKGMDLNGFSILPEMQGRGFGRQILSGTVQMALSEGRDEVRLDVEIDNLKALGLYESCGFRTTDAIEFHEVATEVCDITAPVRNQLTAYNNRDIDAFMSCYTEDCLVEDGMGNRLMQGAEAMRASYAAMFASSPKLHCRLASRVVVGNYILDEERVTGRAGSEEEERHVVAVYRVADGLIQHVRFLR